MVMCLGFIVYLQDESFITSTSMFYKIMLIYAIISKYNNIFHQCKIYIVIDKISVFHDTFYIV